MEMILVALLAFLRDLVSSRRRLVLENVFLRQQILVLERQIGRARPEPFDRGVLAFVARVLPNWRELLRVVEPDTLVRWHRKGFAIFWRWKSHGRRPPTRVSDEVRALVLRMAKDDGWGAKRIVGELTTKLGIVLSRRTVQRILRSFGSRRRSRRQRWRTFLRNHLSETWACDLFTVPTWSFRVLHIFFVMKLGTREVLRWAVTEHPTSEWLAQQLREITPWCVGPRFLVRDRDQKFGSIFDRVARACGTRVLLTPPRFPVANSFAERLVGSVRRECLDHFVIWNESHLERVLAEFFDRYYNRVRPHQGLEQKIPAEVETPVVRPIEGRIASREILGGLMHDYYREAA